MSAQRVDPCTCPRLTCPMRGRHHRDFCRLPESRRADGEPLLPLFVLFVCFALCGQRLPLRHLERLLASNSLRQPDVLLESVQRHVLQDHITCRCYTILTAALSRCICSIPP